MDTYKLEMRHNYGFFSDFLTTIAGIMYCHDNNLNFYIDWRNTYYNFNNDCNLFDKYFHQKTNSEMDFQGVFNTLTPYEYYFAENDGFDKLIKPSEMIKIYDILNNEHFKSIDTSEITSNRVLGVHRRGTDHYLHGELLPDVYYFNEINEEFKKNSYDKILLITDDKNSYHNFLNEYGDILLTTNSTKTDSRLGVHVEGLTNGDVLCKDVILDSFLLSKTDYKLITKSNVSTFSLICNLQKDNYRYIDNHIKFY